MDPLEIILTGDGSHTLRHAGLNETYHSRHGAWQESLHVFIRSGLDYFRQTNLRKDVSILEVGFGTGLNALLAWQYAGEHNIAVHYTTLEPFPLERSTWSKLNYGEGDAERFIRIHEAAWGSEVALAPEFTILKLNTSLQQVHLMHGYGVIFFDAFAPSVQPELWAVEMLKKVAESLREGGVFVTYSAKGQLKRDLVAVGLTVETLPGAPGKKEMVRAVARR